MQRTRYLVAYDIREPRRLRLVHRVVQEWGYPLQYSVFICDLDPTEKVTLRLSLRDTINHDVDSVLFIDLGDPRERGRRCFEFVGEGSADDLPEDGAVVL